jgi:hypothetical protein
MASANLVQNPKQNKLNGTNNSKFVSKFKWSHPNWIDIPEFLKHVYSCSRGEQHRICKDVVIDYQKDWFEIISHNNGKSVNKLLDLFKMLNVQHSFSRLTRDDRNKKFSRDKDNLRAQVGEDLFNLPTTVKDTCRIFQEVGTKLSENIDIITDKVSDITQKFDTVLGRVLLSVQSKFETLKWSYNIVGTWLPQIILFLTKVFAMGYLLSDPANQNLKSVAAVVALALPPTVGGNLEFISGLIRAIKGAIGNIQAQSEDDSSFIKSFYTLTKGVLSGIFSAVDKEAFDGMYISSKKVKLITDYIRGASTIMEFLLKIVEKCLGFVSDKILKHYGVMPWFLKEDRIAPLIDRFIDIKEKRLDQLSGTSRHAAIQVKKLYDDVVKVETDLVKSRNLSKECGIKIMPYLRVMVRSLEQILAKIPNHLLTGKDMRRSKPFWVYIYGKPRIGKSAMFQPYLANILVYALGLRDKMEDYTNFTYFRNLGDKYWEKYLDHLVLWYNDLFQNYSDEEAMHTAVAELTSVVDDSLYALNMAFEDKHGVYFNSPIVLSNSQDDIIGQSFISSKCLSHGEHLYARRNIVVEFCLNDKYLAESGTGINYAKMHQEMAIGPNIGNLFPEDMYVLKFHEPISGNLISEKHFKDGINYIVEAAKIHRASQDDFKIKLYDHFNDIWAQSGDTDQILEDELYAKLCQIEEENDFKRIQQAKPIIDLSRSEYLYNLRMRMQSELQGIMISEPRYKDVSTQTEFPILCEQCFKRSCLHLNLKAQCGESTSVCMGVCEIPNVAMTCRYCTQHVVHCLYKQHVIDCAAQHANIVRCEYDGWFDAKDKIEPIVALENFVAAIMRHCPDIIDAPFTKFVIKAYDEDYKPLIEAVQTAHFEVNQTKDEQMAKISVIIELACVYNWENYYKDSQNPSLWKDFKKSFKSCWSSFVDGLNYMIAHHPFLSWIVFMVVYMGIYISILWMLGDIVPINAQTAEGNNKSKVKQITRVKKQVDKPKAQSYDEQNVVVENKLRDHLCKFFISIRNVEDTQDIDIRHFGSGLCVGSDVFVLPNHFWMRWMELRDFYGTHGNKVILHLVWDSNKTVQIPWDVIKVWQPGYKHTEDLIYIRITKLIQLSHISKFFVHVEDQPTLFETYLYGLRKEDFTYHSMAVSSTEYTTNVTYTHESRVEPVYNGKFAEKQIHVPLCYRYNNSYTVGGDCGLLLIHADSRMNCRKILGMHTAGSVKTGLGISSAIFYEDIKEAFDELYKDDLPITLEDETIRVCNEVIAQSNEYKELEKTGVTIVGYKDNFIDPEIGVNKKFKITLPRKSKINHSLVHDIMNEDFGPTTVAPACLKPFNRDGVIISPLYEGLKKIPRCSNMVSNREICEVSQHMFDSMKSWQSSYKEMRVLTDDEMVNGYGLLKSLDMTTSAGFPYIVIDNSSGKNPYFELTCVDPKKYNMGHIVRKYVEHREFLARQGIIMETFFLDTLKDEVRDLDKVIAGKTRIFQVAPMDFNMLLRKYFGTFISFCHSTYLEGEMAVGINANSLEWSFMIKQLLQNSGEFINGDGKNFDASLGQQYMMEVCEIINHLYDDGKVNALVRRTLFATFLNSRHIVGNLVYMARQGNKSGIALTTIFNNLAGMFAIRLAYLRKYNSLYGFTRMISAKFYGDDDLISVKSNQCLVDSVFYQKVWHYLGVEYTAADKGDVLKPYYKLAEISFLQRGFYEDEKYHVFMPRLCYNTIMEIPRWSESDPYNMNDQMNRFNSALLEMSNYDESQFKDLRKHFVEYISTLQEMGLAIKLTDLFTYRYAKQLVFPEIYTQNPLTQEHRDLLVHIDKCEQMLLLRGGGSE